MCYLYGHIAEWNAITQAPANGIQHGQWLTTSFGQHADLEPIASRWGPSRHEQAQAVHSRPATDVLCGRTLVRLRSVFWKITGQRRHRLPEQQRRAAGNHVGPKSAQGHPQGER